MFLLLSKQEGKVISSATGGWAAHPRVSRLVFFALRAGAPPAFSSPRFNWEPDLPDFCAQACQAFASWLLRGLAAFSGSDPCAVRFSGGARPLHWLPTNARRTAPEGTARPRRRPLPSKVPAAGLFRFQRSRRRGFFFSFSSTAAAVPSATMVDSMMDIRKAWEQRSATNRTESVGCCVAEMSRCHGEPRATARAVRGRRCDGPARIMPATGDDSCAPDPGVVHLQRLRQRDTRAVHLLSLLALYPVHRSCVGTGYCLRKLWVPNKACWNDRDCVCSFGVPLHASGEGAFCRATSRFTVSAPRLRQSHAGRAMTTRHEYTYIGHASC